MSYFQKIKGVLYQIFSVELLKDEPNLKEIAISSEDEILEIAQSSGFPSNISLAEISVSLIKDKEKIFWKIFYAPKDENGLPLKTGHTIYIIDDVTKELVNQFYSPH